MILFPLFCSEYDMQNKTVNQLMKRNLIGIIKYELVIVAHAYNSALLTYKLTVNPTKPFSH